MTDFSSSHSGEAISIYDSRNLDPHEKWWAAHQPFLLSRGYQLRPRFRANWVPSWTLPNAKVDPRLPYLGSFEDSVREIRPNVLDAIRVADGSKVVLRVSSTDCPELSILRYLNHPTPLEVPYNRTVRLLDIVPLPDDDLNVIIVIPFLRLYNRPAFRHLREIVECMTQFFEGLYFLHCNRIAHRDACARNMMMDATHIVPRGFHFTFDNTENGDHSRPAYWRDRCSVPPVQYYFIDFGLSSFFPEGEELALSVGNFGQDRTVPELSDTVPYNPFKVDIYQLGNVFLRQSKKYPAISRYFGPLLLAMTRTHPSDRPSAAEALVMFGNAFTHIPVNELSEKLEVVYETIIDSGASDSDYELVADSDAEC